MTALLIPTLKNCASIVYTFSYSLFHKPSAARLYPARCTVPRRFHLHSGETAMPALITFNQSIHSKKLHKRNIGHTHTKKRNWRHENCQHEHVAQSLRAQCRSCRQFLPFVSHVPFAQFLGMNVYQLGQFADLLSHISSTPSSFPWANMLLLHLYCQFHPFVFYVLLVQFFAADIYRQLVHSLLFFYNKASLAVEQMLKELWKVWSFS